MKKLLLLLILIPVLLSISTTAWSQEKKTAKSRKKAIAELKTLLKKYPNWQWDEEITKDNISNREVIMFLSQYEDFGILLFYTPGYKAHMCLIIADGYYPNWKSKTNGEKTISIKARFSGGDPFETVLESENDIYVWFFNEEKGKTEKNGFINIKEEFFKHKFLYLRYQTDQTSNSHGSYKSLEFNITGAKEILDKAKEILSLE